MTMISEIAIQFENEDDGKKLAQELRERGFKMQGPYYLNRYGLRDRDNPLDVNRTGEYPGIIESQVEGDTKDD